MLQGAAADCNSAGETHAWFDSRVAHHLSISTSPGCAAICVGMTRMLLLPLALLAAPAFAHDYAAGGLRIDHPHAFATPPGAPVAGGYMTIENGAAEDDRLMAIEVDPDVAGTVQLHEMTMDGDVMRMREVEGGIPLPTGETVALEPGGLHVMFLRLPQGFEDGTAFQATLMFEAAGEVEVTFQVERRGAARDRPGHAGHGDGMAGGAGTMDHLGDANGTDAAAGASGEDG